jgi:hypothetical protein
MNIQRIDHSPHLIHFTKPQGDKRGVDGAYSIFKEIISSKKLRAGWSLRLQGIKSICFTEAPVKCLSKEEENFYFEKYKPFGVLFTKSKIFEQGGRHVIYSSKDECESFMKNKDLNWRCVTYNPLEKIDFTWEREWRLKRDYITISPEFTKLVLPNRLWIDKFVNDYEEETNDSCACIRNTKIIRYSDFVKEMENQVDGSCESDDLFPWTMIDMEMDGFSIP